MKRKTLWQRFFYEFVRWFGGALAIVFLRLNRRGVDEWPDPELGGLVCSNHQTFMDPVLVGLAYPGRMNYLARQSLFDIPVLRFLMASLDATPIQREGMGIGGIKETLRRLKRKELVLMFPEGTRTVNGDLQEFKPGFLALVRRSKVPVIPVAIDGAFASWPRDRRLPRPAKVTVTVCPPILAQDYATMNDDELLSELRSRIAGGLGS